PPRQDPRAGLLVSRRRPNPARVREQPELPLAAPKRRVAFVEPEQAAKVAIARRAKPGAPPGYVRLVLSLELRRVLAEQLSARVSIGQYVARFQFEARGFGPTTAPATYESADLRELLTLESDGESCRLAVSLNARDERTAAGLATRIAEALYERILLDFADRV